MVGLFAAVSAAPTGEESLTELTSGQDQAGKHIEFNDMPIMTHILIMNNAVAQERKCSGWIDTTLHFGICG